MPEPETSILERAARRGFLKRAAAAGGAAAVGTAVLRPSVALAATVDGDQSGTFTATQSFAPAADDVPITVRRGAGSSSHLQRWTDAGGSVLARMSGGGRLGLGGVDLYAAASKLLGIDGSAIVDGAVKVRRRDDPANAPEIHFEGANGAWYVGIDVYNSPAADFFIGKKTSDGVGDFVYISHNGTGVPTTGIAVTPPDRLYALQVSGSDGDATVGGLSVRVPPGSSANALAIKDSSGVGRVTIDRAFYLSALRAKARSDSRVLILANPTRGGQYGFYYSGNAMVFRYFNNGIDSFRVGTDGRFRTLVTANLTAGAQLPSTGTATPSGGVSGEIRVGAGGRVWCNDGGTWKSTKLAR